MTHYATSATSGAGDWILGTIKRNPEGLLLLAAGAALLMRSSSSSRRIGNGLRDYERHVDPASRHAGQQNNRRWKEQTQVVVPANICPMWRKRQVKPPNPMPLRLPIMRTTRCRLFQTNRGVLRDKPNQAWKPPQSMYWRSNR